MINKEKLTNFIWHDGLLWEVVKLYQPNPYEDYLVLKRQVPESWHTDNTMAIDMILIDCHNDSFYPDTRRVQRHMRMMAAEKERVREEGRKSAVWLDKLWLAFFPEEKYEE